MIRVLVVDDSRLTRRVLASRLGAHPGIAVVGTASDPYEARDLVVRLRPDVITLDIEMPAMDGLSFLNALTRHFPVPTVVVSSLAPKGSEMERRAFQAGAADVIAKPSCPEDLDLVVADLANRLREAVARSGRPPGAPAAEVQGSLGVVALGCSTGGVKALEAVLRALPADTPGILAVQHLPAEFTRLFASRLDAACDLEVKEAQDGDVVRAGRCLIAPGDRHLLLARDATGLRATVRTGPRVNRHRPSADVLFRSVARVAGSDAIGVIMTGMGADGARGLKAMHDAGALTIAQDERTCAVFGMPKAAIGLGGVSLVVALDQIAEAIVAGSRKAAA